MQNWTWKGDWWASGESATYMHTQLPNRSSCYYGGGRPAPGCGRQRHRGQLAASGWCQRRLCRRLGPYVKSSVAPGVVRHRDRRWRRGGELRRLLSAPSAQRLPGPTARCPVLVGPLVLQDRASRRSWSQCLGRPPPDTSSHQRPIRRASPQGTGFRRDERAEPDRPLGPDICLRITGARCDRASLRRADRLAIPPHARWPGGPRPPFRRDPSSPGLPSPSDASRPFGFVKSPRAAGSTSSMSAETAGEKLSDRQWLGPRPIRLRRRRPARHLLRDQPQLPLSAPTTSQGTSSIATEATAHSKT